MLYLAGFIICAVIIFFAGKRLSVYGDLLADKTGLSKGWIGIILMASVTSLPELMVGISSSALVKSADLATGDILGSCAFNLGILAMMDAFVPHRKPLFGVASQSHVLSASLGIILIAMAGFGIFLPKDIILTSWIGLTSLLFIGIYLASVRLIYKHEAANLPATATTREDARHAGISKSKIVRNYVISALIIIITALALPYFAEKIAEESGLSKSFVGTLFLATSTSLPEIAVSIAAVRMGSIDMAVGGLLGSNIFNILILALDDLFYTRGHILKDASELNILSVFSTIIMSAVVIIGLSYRLKGKKYMMAWDTALIFLIYIINVLLLYHFTS
jgi:cation:H+ antiporter